MSAIDAIPVGRRWASLRRGFTLIELVTVIVIVAALAAFVAPQLNVAGFERYAFRQEVLAGLRYAQKTAVAGGCPVQVSFDTDPTGVDGDPEGFSLDYENDPGDNANDCGDGSGTFDDPVPDLTGGDFDREAEASVDMSASRAQIVFTGTGSLEGGDATVSFADPDTDAITINAVTGYVQD